MWTASARTPADRDQRLVRGFGFQRVNFAATDHGVPGEQKATSSTTVSRSAPAGRSGSTRQRSSAVLSQTRTSTSSANSQPEFAQHAARSITECERLQSRCVPDGLLEFCPSKQISQARLEIIRLSLIRCGSSLSPFGNQNQTLGQLVLRQPLALRPQLRDLYQTLGPLQFVITSLDRNCDLLFQAAHILFSLRQLRFAFAHDGPPFAEVEHLPI